jgi:ligand-binding sensor domain-containing protein/DNA-binding response OmpR family regulator/two-component sensor histidine kinase
LVKKEGATIVITFNTMTHIEIPSFRKSMNDRRGFTICVFLIINWIAFPGYSQQDLTFRQLSVNDGLSQNSAVSVTQDNDGFLWIATQEGLNRYDGREFRIYKKKFADITQETHLQLGKVFADSKNRIWIIPDTSIPEILDRTIDMFYPVDGVEAASCIHEDPNGDIWTGSFSGQLCRWNENIRSFEIIWNDPSREIKDLESFDNRSLLLTFKDGVALFNKETATISHFDLPDIKTYYSCSKADSKGNVWVGSLNSGIWLIPGGEKSGQHADRFFINSGLQLDEKMVLDITIDSRENVWFATYGMGSVVFNWKDNQFRNYTYSKQNPRSIHYNDILCIFEDYTATLWFGTDGGGLSFYDTYLEKFNYFHNQQVPENINIDVVRSLFVDEKDHIWIGTSGKGLTEYDPAGKIWKTYTYNENQPHNIASNRVMSLLGDGQGKLWIGYQDEGLSILDLNTRIYKQFNTDSKIPLPAKTVWKILKDSDDRFWLATRNNGLIQFDPRTGVVRQFTHNPFDPQSIPENNIRTIEESKNGAFWIGTETQGIAKFDPESGTFTSWKHQPGNRNSISSNSIKSLYPDSNNVLWIGTNGAGLNAMNLKTMKITRITADDGLANDVIYGILPDHSGNLWLSSNMGISKVSLSYTDSLVWSITNFTNYEGQASEFNTGAYYQHNDGTIYFGSLEGFYWFRSEDIILNETAPRTAITDFFVFNESYYLSNLTRLKHNQNTITIHMASLVFSSPHKNEYQYKLVNHDKDWVYSGNNHQARYTNLHPGEYTFLAKSSNYDGIWADTPVIMTFTILSPWYKTVWAYIFYVIMTGVLLFWFYQYLKWHWFMQVKLRLKENEAARLQEINEFKNNFFTNISHEFRTPLTLISGPVDRMLSQSENPVLKSQLNLIKHNANRLLNLVDQLMEVSRIKAGKQKLNVEKGNLGLLIQTIVVNYFPLAMQKNISIKTDIPIITEVWYDADKLEKIVGNLTNNAIKYGKPDTDVKIICKLSDTNLRFTIENESITRYDQEEIKSLSERFFQKNSKREGYGIGISLVNDLVKICHGQSEMNFLNEKIFHVSVSIPVTRNAYHPDELEGEDDKEDVQLINDHQVPMAGHDAPIILIVEDNEELRKFLIGGLQPFYQTLEAKNGNEGLCFAFKKIPDLIISDIMMPEMDGIELCHTVKTDEKTSHIPVILLTAKSDEEDIMRGLEAGADDYFLKPVSMGKLLLRAEKLIDLRRKLRNYYGTKARISPKELALTSIDEKFLTKVQEIVDREICDANFSAEKFSRKIGMSRMQLHRKLTAITGLSANAFIRDQRLQMAAERLKNNSGNVSEIAYEVGFSTPSYFIKCFKDSYQMTPNEYIKRKKLNINHSGANERQI